MPRWCPWGGVSEGSGRFLTRDAGLGNHPVVGDRVQRLLLRDVPAAGGKGLVVGSGGPPGCGFSTAGAVAGLSESAAEAVQTAETAGRRSSRRAVVVLGEC
jgi:hypothetical protein